MKILFISNPELTPTRRWVDWFRSQGHTVHLLADTPMPTPWPDVAVEFLRPVMGMGMWRFIPWLRHVKRVIREFKPDILHAHRVSSAGWLGAFSGYHPFVLTPWGSDLYLHALQSWLTRSLAHVALQRADLITADSIDLLNTAEKMGASPNKLNLVQWGVDLDLFHPTKYPSPWREKLQAGQAPIVLSMRAVHPVYNLESLIDAIPLVLEHISQVLFVFRDYNTDEEYKHSLIARIAATGCSGAVRWIGRLEPWGLIADVYRAADVAVSIPVSDSTPISMLEAFASGVPVIASDLASIREWIIPGVTGLIVPARDVNALADAIVQLLQRQNLSERIAAEARKLVEKRADHTREMQRMESLYRSLIG